MPADAYIHIELRTAVGCWAARHASLLKGDFVKCGVNTGVMSLAICEYLDFNSIDKRFFMFDNYEWIPLSQINEVEAAMDRASDKEYDFNSYELLKRNFSPYPRVKLIKGVVPDSFVGLDIESVTYLSIDMNIAYPESASIGYFWPKLTAGAIVLLDDYGWLGYDEQKKVMNDFAAKHGTEVLTLLIGQGLLLKP